MEHMVDFRKKQDKKKRKLRQAGFTLIEVMIVIGIIALVVAISIPKLLRARHNANEAAAQSSLRIICTACISYMGSNEAYPEGLDALANEIPPYLNSVLSQGTYRGYIYDYERGETVFSFTCTAEPQSPGFTGTRSFIVDESGLISELKE